MSDILIWQRKIKPGDIFVWYKSSLSVGFVNSHFAKPDLVWLNGDKKWFFKELTSSLFSNMAEMLAETHGMYIQPVELSGINTQAYLFKRRKKPRKKSVKD